MVGYVVLFFGVESIMMMVSFNDFDLRFRVLGRLLLSLLVVFTCCMPLVNAEQHTSQTRFKQELSAAPMCVGDDFEGIWIQVGSNHFGEIKKVTALYGRWFEGSGYDYGFLDQKLSINKYEVCPVDLKWGASSSRSGAVFRL